MTAGLARMTPTTGGNGMTTRHLVDPELLAALEVMPSRPITAENLAEVRAQRGDDCRATAAHRDRCGRQRAVHPRPAGRAGRAGARLHSAAGDGEAGGVPPYPRWGLRHRPAGDERCAQPAARP